ncbi:MAG: SOS response-associated peptidase [Candidatus Omnitrophica bacterium]|nr:SOS response-associated peptidase [Candidatus Omnitrophota bacterium]
MCGRFSLTKSDKDTLKKRFRVKRVAGDQKPRYNIAPSDAVHAIVNTMRDEITLARWGYIPHWMGADGLAKSVINARAETLMQKPFFKTSFRSRRCLIIADGFYEWKRAGKAKHPYRVIVDDGSLFAFAGVWDTWMYDGNELMTCAIITVAANELMRPIHERMPVIINADDEQAWLMSDDLVRAEEMLRPFASERMRAYEISPAVNSPTHDHADIVKPI